LPEVRGYLPGYCLLPDRYRLDLISDRSICNVCNCRLRIIRTVFLRPVSIVLGRALVIHHIKHCHRCARDYPYEHLHELIPPASNYSYDIIVEVGIARYMRHMQNKEIQQHLQNRFRLFVSASTINHLARRFLDYLSAVHYANTPRIRDLVKNSGGYILHIDGTCEPGTDFLFVAMDGIAHIVLATSKMSTENVYDVKNIINRCIQFFGYVLAVVRDLSEQIELAIKELLTETKDFICQYHFLQNVGERLFEKPHVELSSKYRELKIKKSFAVLRNDLVKQSKKRMTITEKQLIAFLENPQEKDAFDTVQICQNLAYCILRWLDDYTCELKGEYFPFDQPHLVYYRRCVKVYDILKRLGVSKVSKNIYTRTFQSITRILESLIDNEQVKNIAQNFEHAVQIFEELRRILRFKRNDNKPLLRHRSPISTIENVQKIEIRLNELKEKMHAIIIKNENPHYVVHAQIVVDYLEKYGNKLFGHVISVPHSNQTILVSRTNNIPEHLFNCLKKRWRRQQGKKKLTRVLQSAYHEELLVANLENKEYVNIVYGGNLKNMSTCFAQYHTQTYEIQKTRKAPEQENKLRIRKKFIRMHDFMKKIGNAISVSMA